MKWLARRQAEGQLLEADRRRLRLAEEYFVLALRYGTHGRNAMDGELDWLDMQASTLAGQFHPLEQAELFERCAELRFERDLREVKATPYPQHQKELKPLALGYYKLYLDIAAILRRIA
ncbi:hypothetical protein KSX_91070 [Ktedonospora formicarum]|uniref:Uncharacterized protein n=1 Tax=Ktedonospora formicarum TaxID=2778364 RepID=A0A8J3IFG6_9CHLR|nr:hypothetical protein KSX_91070 [Ktedonospora formicarum]